MIGSRWPGGGRVGWNLAVVALLVALPPARTETANPEPKEEQQARAILIRWLDVIGGATEVRDLRTLYFQCQVSYGSAVPPLALHVRAMANGLYRFEYAMPAHGQLVQAFDGRTAWQYNVELGFGFQSASEHQSNQFSCDFRAPIRVGSQFPGRKVLPEETIGGRKLQVVELRTAAGRVEKWYFDPATGYRVRVETPGPSGPLVVEFDDFRQAAGARVREPYRVTRTEAGRKVEVTMQLMYYNDEMDPGLFAAPAGPTEDNQQVQRLLYYNAQLRGSDALRQVGTRVTEEVTQILTSGLETRTKIYQKRPNLIVSEQDVPGMGKIWQGYDGEVGWVWSELEGYRTMQGAELQQMLGLADLEGPLKLSEQCPFRRLLEEKVVNGRRLTGIALASLQGQAGNFYFDPRTAELVEVETFVQAGASGQLKMTAEFSDYRKVDGVMIPYVTRLTNPAMQMVMTVESVKHNVPIDDALFRPKKE